MSSNTSSTPYVVDDCRGVLKVYSDGSIVRSAQSSSFNVSVEDDGSVVFKDVLFDPTHDLYLRLYKPTTTTSTAKLPIFYYIHGGGFCAGSRTWPAFHNYCFRLSSQLQAIVVAPDYRLAPEHRLPAAIDDCFTAMKWLQTQGVSDSIDPWLSEADFDRVFVSGDSAGGNIVHNLAVGLGAGSVALAPVHIRGYVLLEPFFGGTVLTKGEAEGLVDAFLNWELIDRYWRLSLPIGHTRDHPLVNPFGPRSPSLESMTLDPILVVIGGSDLLKDRAKDYAMKLNKWGKSIEYIEFEGKQHCFFTVHPNSDESVKLMQTLKQFIADNSA